MERRKDKAGQAEDVEMQRPGSASAPEVDEQSDGQVGHADDVLVEDGRIPLGLADNDVGLELDAAALDSILRLVPSSQPRQHLGRVYGVLDLDTVNRNQPVADSETGLEGRAVRSEKH